MRPILPLVFVCPPAGKPDPSAAPPANGEKDTRLRVRQKGNKDSQCWFYAFNILRPRQGKHADVQGSRERQFERAVSSLRKQVGAHERNLPVLCDQLGQPTARALLAGIDKSRADALCRHASSRPQLETALGAGGLTALKLFAERGVEATFFDHLLQKKFGKRHALQQQFLDAVGEPKKAHLEPALLGAEVNRVCAERWNFRPASWTPADSVDELAALLAQQGPLLIAGRLGAHTYTQAAILLKERVAGNAIFGWPASSAKPPDQMFGHMVVLVGCQRLRAQKARVYFVDPDDASGGVQAPNRRIYTLSYAAFVERCSSFDGVMGASSSSCGFLFASRGQTTQ